MSDWHPVIADWPAPPGVHALTTTRTGGVSAGAYDSLNLGAHTNDLPEAVAENRRLLRYYAGLPDSPLWLAQVHGRTVVPADEIIADLTEADGAWTDRAGVVLAVLTADCLPVVLCDRAGTVIACAHAGWRGLHAGVLEAAVAALPAGADQLMAWLGPAIGPERFEVGDEVRAAFLEDDPSAEPAFRAGGPGHWYADLYALARGRLARAGVTAIFGGGLCTAADPARFYSYRRDGDTGRMATLIWIDGAHAT